jgi:hypothetical protein
MKFMKRKKTNENSESEIDVNILTKQARNLILRRIEESITKRYKQGKVVFKDGENVEYTNVQGEKSVMSILELSILAWGIFNDEMVGTVGSIQANLIVLGITPSDIEVILRKLKNGGNNA